MKKILIADDEFLVRLGLKTTINWQEHGFVIVGEAKNGKEALELFEEFNPEILLTDIRMPIMDGLELIQAIKQRKKSLKSVILTHFDDFSYAQEAIKLGASEYILKSDLNSDNLFNILNKLSAEIDAENEISDESPTKSVKSTGTIDSVAAEYKLGEGLLKKLADEGFKSQEIFSQFLEKCKNIFKYNHYIIFTGQIEDISSKSINKDQEYFEKTIRNMLNQSLDSKDTWFCTYINRDQVTGLINISVENDSEKVLNNLYNFALLFKHNLKQFLEADITIGFSVLTNKQEDLLTLLKQSRIAQKYCYFELSGITTFDYKMLEKTEDCPRVSLDILKTYVRTLETDKIIHYINSVFDILAKLKQVGYVKDVFIDFMSFARIITTELNLEKGEALSESKFSYNIFDKLTSFEAVKKYVLDIYYSLREYSSGNKPDGYSHVIRKCIVFIKQNYQKNVTLSDAALNVNVSNSYLSLLFKQETGINFSNYLTNYRIEEAKNLLKATNLKIYEIAYKVGFDSPYYFSKVFKDIVGSTCKEFKNRNI
jgi:two-component system, response regulator YesN